MYADWNILFLLGIPKLDKLKKQRTIVSTNICFIFVTNNHGSIFEYSMFFFFSFLSTVEVYHSQAFVCTCTIYRSIIHSIFYFILEYYSSAVKNLANIANIDKTIL